MNCEYELDIHLKHLGTLQIVSFLVFAARKTPVMCFVHLCAPHDIIAMETTPPSGRAHPHLHPVQV